MSETEKGKALRKRTTNKKYEAGWRRIFGKCKHEKLVSAKNEVIESGWYCPDCNCIFAEDPRKGIDNG